MTAVPDFLPDDTLKGRRVLELSSRDGLTALCGRLLADLGAEVLVPAEWPLRDAPVGPSTPEYADYERVRLLSGKHCSKELDPAEVHRLQPMLESTDLVIVDTWWHAVLMERGIAVTTWESRWPHLVVGYLTPFGLDGPLSGVDDSDLLVQAAGGLMAANGRPDDPPIRCGVPVADTAGALFAVSALLAALHEREQSRMGQVVDVAAFDAVVCLLGTLLPTYFVHGRPPPRVGNRHVMTAPWNTYSTSDGWIVLATMGEKLWAATATMIGRSDLIDNVRFATAELRVAHVDELDEIIEGWTRQRTQAEVQEAGQRLGVPCGAINRVGEALEQPFATERRLVSRRGATGEFPQPGSPLPRTSLAEGSAAAKTARAVSPPADDNTALPLAGVRVVELAALTAGPLTGRLLAMLGADVLKLEPRRGESARHLAGQVDGVGYLYYLNNTDKRGAVLDVDDEDGRRRLEELLHEADVLLTNLSASALGSRELDPATVTSRHEQLVYCTISGYGMHGSRVGERAFDTIVQAECGIMALTGVPEKPPLKTAISFADLLGAAVASAATIASLHRNESASLHLDVALVDGAVWSTQRRWVDRFVGGHEPERCGNDDASRPASGLYACSDGHIAVDATDPIQHQAAVAIVSELSAVSVDQALQRCQAVGVPAVEVVDLASLAEHPHVRSRSLVLEQRTPEGTKLRVLGSPWKFSRSDVRVRHRAPSLGEHECRW